MDDHEQNSSYTLLRIKRKRTDEPLDALVFEPRVRKKKSRGVGVFQFAQTVEQDAWEDEKRRKDLENEISRLARGPIKTEATSSGPSSPTVLRNPGDDPSRRYKIIEADPLAQLDNRSPSPNSPKEPSATTDTLQKRRASDFRMYDAILSPTTNDPVFDSEMEKFLPMLNNYLKIHDIPLSTCSNNPPTTPSTPSSDDYVWDVFYHHPMLSELTEAANVGTLTGLPQPITDPYDSLSESEEEDHADEDSNAEEYYKNDYPEEEDWFSESSASDELHYENSDQSDFAHDDDDDDVYSDDGRACG